MDSQLWPRHGGHSLCYLSRDTTHEGPCSFAIAAGAVGLASAVLSACLRCLSLDCCGLGPIGSIALAGINSLWWVLAAALLTAAAVDADAGGVPGAAARHALLAAAWLAAATEAAHSIAACATVGNNVCNVLFCAPLLPAAEDECCAGCEECCVGSGHHGGGCCCCRSRRWRRHHAAPLLPHGTTITPAGAVVIATAGAAVGRSWLDAFRPRPQPNMHVPAMASVGPYGPAPPCPGAAWPHTATAHGAAALPSSGGYMVRRLACATNQPHRLFFSPCCPVPFSSRPQL